jgi:cob(I)alamin adenosyltransferase
MALYTRSGDRGETSLFDGSRVAKDDLRVVAYGELDELNSLLGLCRCAARSSVINGRAGHVQHELFAIGRELATPPGGRRFGPTGCIGPEQNKRLENWIDDACEVAPALRDFVLPGGTELTARLHLARTCCRRAERSVVTLHTVMPVREEIIIYLNRLSDLLFAWARQANQEAGVEDIIWVPLE